MAKVTISLDDTRPEIIALFGENALETVADDMGYMAVVHSFDADGEVMTDNPLTKAQFVGQQILRNRIIPALTERFEQRRKREAENQIRVQMAQVVDVLESVAEITTE